jgi:hypothetical protein
MTHLLWTGGDPLPRCRRKYELIQGQVHTPDGVYLVLLGVANFGERRLQKLSDKWPEDVSGLRFCGAERQLGACLVPLSRLWGPGLGPILIYQTVSPRSALAILERKG